MGAKTRILFFYSYEPFPSIEKWHKEVIDYLEKSKKEFNYDLEIINIRKHMDLAEKHKIPSTPALLIISAFKEERHIGLMGLKQILAIFRHTNTAIMHANSYKKGRELAQKYQLKNLDKTELENNLKEILQKEYCSDVKLEEFDKKMAIAKITLKSEFALNHSKGDEPVDYSISGLLGGLFMEIFDKPMYFIEKKCIAKGDEYCEFEVR